MSTSQFIAIQRWEELQDKLDVFGLCAEIVDNEVYFLDKGFSHENLEDFYKYMEGWIDGALADKEMTELAKPDEQKET